MAIVKQTNKKTGVTYVYEAHSYRDPVTKQPRSKRRLVGRIDEETGKIVPTKRKRCTAADITSDTDEVVTSLIDAIAERDETICSLRGEISMLQREIHKISDDLVSFGRRLAQQH